MNANYKEITIYSNNTPIVLSIWKHEDNSPNILFLPGTMAYPLITEDFLNKLSNQGFNVFGLHYLSHGKSPKIVKKYTFNDMLNNVSDSISYIKKNYKGKIGLMGSSQGGILAISYASKDNRISAVFPHNIMDNDLKETLSITAFPKWMGYYFNGVKAIMKLLGKCFPLHPIHFSSYLDSNKVFSEEDSEEKMLNDPYMLKTYPLCFMASLFNADMKGIKNGNISCPVVAITTSGDPLFSLEYTKKVFNSIIAPEKELIVIEKNTHLLFKHCQDEALNALMPRFKKYLY